jgi:large subunit ribosomal protein L7/L12
LGPLILFVFGLVCGVALALFLVRRDRNGQRDLTAPPPSRLSPPRASGTDINEAEIIVLLRLGRKIEAVKRMRELTGMGLAEAKDAVEAIEREQG